MLVLIDRLRSLSLYQAPGPTAQPSWRYLPHCLAAALLLRLGLHMFSDFVSYPDELQQYLEQGHKLAFGYGLITWEWHWGARNYLLPGVIAGLLLPFKWLGIDHPAYYVPFVEAFFCIFSLLIPWGLYHFTRHQHGEAAGRIALLLGVVNFYLLAFAAKTLTGMLAGVMLAAALGLAGRPFIRGDAGAWVFGILLGVAAFLRYLYLPALGILWLAVAFAMPARWILRSIAGGLLAILAYGMLDFLTWGRLFNSIYMHILWNLSPPENFHTGERRDLLSAAAAVHLGRLHPARCHRLAVAAAPASADLADGAGCPAAAHADHPQGVPLCGADVLPVDAGRGLAVEHLFPTRPAAPSSLRAGEWHD